MAAIAIAAAGLAVSATGTYMNYEAGKKQQAAQEQIIAQQQQQEALRERQMQLDAQRRRNDMVRQAMQARSMSASITSNQGAGSYGSSAFPGASGGISGSAENNILGVNQGEEIGTQMFGLNAGILSSYRDSAAASSMAGFGSGLMSLGGGLMNNNVQIAKVGSTIGSFFGPSNPGSGFAFNG